MAATYYVYHLIDPRDNRVFYVGKGQGGRMHQHEKEAQGPSEHPKCAVIRAIWAAGLQVGKVKAKSFDDEQAAYDFEAAEIQRLGFESLTNLCRGGGRARDGEPSKAFSPVEAVIKFAGHFAYWLIKTDAGRIKNRIVFTVRDKATEKIRNDIVEVMWGKFLPDLWAKATAKPENLPRLAETFKRYGIELVPTGAAQ